MHIRSWDKVFQSFKLPADQNVLFERLAANTLYFFDNYLIMATLTQTFLAILHFFAANEYLKLFFMILCIAGLFVADNQYKLFKRFFPAVIVGSTMSLLVLLGFWRWFLFLFLAVVCVAAHAVLRTRCIAARSKSFFYALKHRDDLQLCEE
eukprot:gnl/Trimastix_PCT/1137.p2 GENE.gnl/Trimastix_PCT/1137~~gnl/Trimastix_PCT/1137.p2  ORF type:complete len:167 (+),score=31.24 gnl/Trimastix_PCT/1137:49-501(+)